MARQLKVYGTGTMYVSPPEAAEQGLQLHVPGKRTLGVRAVVAAPSKAAAVRLFAATMLLRHYAAASMARNGGETGNDVEIAVAMSKPGTVFATVEDGGRTAEDYVEVSA